MSQNDRPWDWEERIANDQYKNELAKKEGYILIRIWDNEILLVWRFAN